MLYDPYPEPFNPASSSDMQAWAQVLPNFPFNGHLFSKSRYGVCWVSGSPVVFRRDLSSPHRVPPAALVHAPYPPESETADVVVWEGRLLQEYLYWRRRYEKDAGEFDPLADRGL